MLSVAEAQAIIEDRAKPLPAVSTVLAPESLGLVLAEDIASDLDIPPFDKALMDGYAIRVVDLANGHAVLQIVDEVTAGQTPKRAVGSGQAIRVMTGAPVPEG